MPDVQRYLREDEYDLLHDRYHCDLAHVALRKQRDLLQKNLSAARALLEEAKQYVQDEFRGMAFDEEQEREWQKKGQDLITAIAAQLAGTRGGK